MFSPCPGFPVPLVGTWRSSSERFNRAQAYQMNWLGYPGADLATATPADEPADALPKRDGRLLRDWQ